MEIGQIVYIQGITKEFENIIAYRQCFFFKCILIYLDYTKYDETNIHFRHLTIEQDKKSIYNMSTGPHKRNQMYQVLPLAEWFCSQNWQTGDAGEFSLIFLRNMFKYRLGFLRKTPWSAIVAGSIRGQLDLQLTNHQIYQRPLLETAKSSFRGVLYEQLNAVIINFSFKVFNLIKRF